MKKTTNIDTETETVINVEKEICTKCECEIEGPVFQDENEEPICEDCMIQSMLKKFLIKEV